MRVMRSWLKIVVSLCCVSLLAVAVAGCKPGVPSESKAFQSAKPEIKAAWDKAMAASKSNDYAVALTTLWGLRGQAGLTTEQEQVVEQAATVVNDRMYDAANKGDEQAKKALNDLRNVRGR